jgi:hypothetical protein
MQQNNQPKEAAPNIKPKLSRYSQPKAKTKNKNQASNQIESSIRSIPLNPPKKEC